MSHCRQQNTKKSSFDTRHFRRLKVFIKLVLTENSIKFPQLKDNSIKVTTEMYNLLSAFCSFQLKYLRKKNVYSMKCNYCKNKFFFHSTNPSIPSF